jgi:hypothetical protein
MTLLANLQPVFMGQATAAIREQYSAEELSFAAEIKYRASGHLDAAKVLKDIGQGSPSRASDYRNSVTSIRGIPMDGDEAVAFTIQNELSRRQCENTRANAIKRNYYLYPSYHIVSEAKKRCYPEGIFISKTCAEIKLQNLLNHTASWLILTLMYSKVSHMMQLKNCIYIANGVAMAHLGKAHINRNYVTMEID